MFHLRTLLHTGILHLDYCNWLLAGVPACTIRPPQFIQNAAARLVFDLLKFTHTTPLLHALHRLPMAARIPFKTLVLACRAANGSGPSYIQDKVKTLHHSPSTTLCYCQTACYSLTTRRVQLPLNKNHNCLLSWQWNELPIDIRSAETLHIFHHRLKTHLSRLHLDP